MSVIPLIEDHTFVASQDDFAQGGGILGSRLLIKNFDKTQFAQPGANVSYDLRVGPKYRDHREQLPRDVEPGGNVSLLPGSAIIVQTEEEVHFPRMMFGYVVPKVGLLQKGLSNTMSKVDHGYHGPLVITLFNLGKQEITLQRGQPFCALVIHTTLEGATLYEGVAKQVAGQRKRGFMYRFRQLHDRLETHQTTISIALILATMMLALVTFLDVGSHSAPFLMHLWHEIRGN